MSNNLDKTIDQYSVERPCEGNFDKSKLGLKDVNRTITQYSKKMIQLNDSEITRLVQLDSKDPDYFKAGIKRTYFLAVEMKYRQDFEPTGYGLGELINSISLLPNEELTLEVKTWETSKTQQDQEEQLESKNISDIQDVKSDAKEILDDYNEKTHHEFDAHASASWGWGSASANYGFSNDVQQQHKTITKYAQDVTRKSINSISNKRSIKISVSRETGSEEKTTRKIKNINQCRTLNINYYQVLKEYVTKTYIDGINLILYGPWIYKETWDSYVDAKLNLEGIMVQALKVDSLDTDGDLFQLNVLRHLIPRPDAVKITNESTPRAIYGYEIIPGFVNTNPKGMRELLNYLYGFNSTASPPEHMNGIPLIRETDFYKGKSIDAKNLTDLGAMLIPRVNYLSDVPLSKIVQVIKTVNNKIVSDYIEVIRQIGEEQSNWKFTLPSHGIYAETNLGVCSGCEDYIEVQREFDLELKRMEIEKLKLEIEKLKILNQKTEQSSDENKIIISSPPQQSTIQLNVEVPSGDKNTEVSFE